MVSQMTGAGPMAVKTADFNNDGFLDLAVANHDGNTTSILLGNGNGSFKKHVDLWNGPNAGTNGIAIGDINRDKRLDIVVVNRGGSNVGVFLAQGGGNFSEQRTFSTGNGSSPAGLALGDLNNDSILDLVITDHVNGSVLIFLGNGDGTFVETQKLGGDIDSGPYLMVINDFNKDNRLDIAVGNGDANYMSVFLGDGVGKFSREIKYYTEAGPYALVTGDFDRDGILDIVTGNYYANSTSIFFGNGDATFREGNTFSTGGGSLPYAVVSGDFDADNILDLAVPNSGKDNVGILLGHGYGEFANQKTYSTGKASEPVDIIVGDFNGDNRLDVISVNLKNNTIGIFLNTCS